MPIDLRPDQRVDVAVEDERAAELGGPPVEPLRLVPGPPAHAVAGLEDHHAAARPGQLARRRGAGEPGADDGDVVAPVGRIDEARRHP